MNIALIWDFDGTIVDSYPIILRALLKSFEGYNLDYTEEEIYAFIKRVSVEAFFLKISSEIGIEISTIRKTFQENVNKDNHDYKLITHAKEILDFLKDKKTHNFIFTHSGKKAIDILTDLGIKDYFEEVITKEMGFPRKPDRKAIDYLVDKYSLDRKNTYYIGDRELDIDCAKNSEILSILLSDDLHDIGETYRIKDLLDIKDIVKSIDGGIK